MFKKLKKIFGSKQEPVIVKVNIDTLEEWFADVISTQNHALYFQEYFVKVKSIQEELKEKVEVLKNHTLSAKDTKQVEARVQNIVLGHRNNYCREIGQFADKIKPLENYSTIQEFQDAVKFNTKLDAEIEALAQRTNKGYQATQHLFFDQVEPIFKLMGELNILVKNFDTTRTEKLQILQTSISSLNKTITHKEEIQVWIENIKKKVIQLEKSQKEESDSIKKLNDSKELQEYNSLTEKEKTLKRKLAILENEVFAYFSKLQKPLKKYERIALDSKPIKPYLEDSVAAFGEDNSLQILGVLEKLQSNVSEFDDKQQKKFIELISKRNFLTELAAQRNELHQEITSTSQEIEHKDIMTKIEVAERKMNDIIQKTQHENTKLEEFRAKLERVDVEKKSKEFCKLVKEVLGLEIRITSFSSSSVPSTSL